MADDLKPEIIENAQSPRKASGDQGSVESHSLPDQIAADLHVASKNAVRGKNRGFNIGRFKPGGST